MWQNAAAGGACVARTAIALSVNYICGGLCLSVLAPPCSGPFIPIADMLAMFTGCLRPCLQIPYPVARLLAPSFPIRHPPLLLPLSQILAGCCRVATFCLFVRHFRRFPADLCKTVAFFNCILHSSCKFRHQLRHHCYRHRHRHRHRNRLQALDSGVLFPLAPLVCVVQFSHICATLPPKCATHCPRRLTCHVVVPFAGVSASSQVLPRLLFSLPLVFLFFFVFFFFASCTVNCILLAHM